MPPRKRAATAATATKEEHKRFRSAIDEMAEELVCPITQELPVDPVTAEDGRVYERSAIEAHIRGRSAEALKSPITNEPMGPRLLPYYYYLHFGPSRCKYYLHLDRYGHFRGTSVNPPAPSYISQVAYLRSSSRIIWSSSLILPWGLGVGVGSG